MNTVNHPDSTSNSSLLFWLQFFLLNALLFLPIYLFYRADMRFWPLGEYANSGEGASQTLLLSRTNLDIFRLGLEWLLLVTVWVFLPRRWRRPSLAAVFSTLYFLQLLYAVYEGFVTSFYLLDPNFYNDYYLFTDGATFVLNSLDLSIWAYVGGALLIGAAIAGLIFLLRRLFDPDLVLGNGGRMALLLLLGGGLLSFGLSGEMRGGMETAVPSFATKLAQNINRSRAAYADARRFDQAALSPHYTFTSSELAQKPDIYLIFIESYGSVLFQRGDFLPYYRVLVDQLERELTQHDWHAASNRSVAPTWGGGSWISYTSALAGLRLETHAQYEIFLNQYQNEPFPHLFNYLRGQGYRSYRLSGMASEIDEAELARYQSFYGIDEWIRFSDVPYTGPLYGWGPALPDQYALNYAHQQMAADNMPSVFFYITQNSHYPWAPLPEIVEDWQTLNNLPPAAAIENQSHQELRRSYLNSILYELEMLVDFIIREGDEDDIFVLVGDHQPSRVARYADGWDTPLHVISRDAAFVTSFQEMGFVNGLDTRDLQAEMHHEGLYSLLARALLQQYGTEPSAAPPYLPTGIPPHAGNLDGSQYGD